MELSEHRAFLIGMPLQIQDKGLCNAIVFVQNRAVRGIITKKYLAPDEQRYFVRGEGNRLERKRILKYVSSKFISRGYASIWSITG